MSRAGYAFRIQPRLSDLDEEETMTEPREAFVHETVLRHEVVRLVEPGEGTYVDVTLGGGGHAEALLEASPAARVIGMDRDPRALAHAKERLARFGARFVAEKATFLEVSEVLSSLSVREPAGIVADLGISSPQIDDPSRGMSFLGLGPLDMRMDPTTGESALELIHRLDQDELANVIYRYGEERRSRSIARSIKRLVAAGELETTHDLRRAVINAVGPHRAGGVDPATRTFQAIRIAVNEELDQLEALLASARTLLPEGGRLAVISFHSLEDRLVKRAFQDRAAWQPLTKKPVVPTDEEQAKNRRSRSAKLRVAERLGAHVDDPWELTPRSTTRLQTVPAREEDGDG